MDKRINSLLEKYLVGFKDQIKKKVAELGFEEKSKTNDLLEFVYEFERLVFTKDDFIKRKRVQNTIPVDNRCIATKSGGERCTRRRKDGCEFCGTHSKNILNDTEQKPEGSKNMDVFAKEMEGIVYYVDTFQNVYRTEDILNEIHNPKIVARYDVLTGGRCVIREI
jgi:hypothetical protein